MVEALKRWVADTQADDERRMDRGGGATAAGGAAAGGRMLPVSFAPDAMSVNDALELAMKKLKTELLPHQGAFRRFCAGAGCW